MRRFFILLFFLGILISISGCLAEENYPEELIKYCFLYEENNQKYFLDDGEVFIDKQEIGRTNNGCIKINENQCKNYNSGKLILIPDKINKFDYPLGSQENINPCESINIIIPQDYIDTFNELSFAQPYVENIVLKDDFIRKNAIELVKDCESGDKTCEIDSIYKSVITNLKYISDPRNAENIQTPQETLELKAGDCEDLTAVLNSYLENIGIKTYIVLTNNHAYSLACGVDLDEARANYIPIGQSSIYYNISDENCLVLDATAGKNGYIGYGENIKDKKIAIDPVNYEIVNLL